MRLYNKFIGKEEIKNGKAAFVIPFWSDGKPKRLAYLNNSIESIKDQSDSKYTIYIVDDCSESNHDKKILHDLMINNEDIKVIFANINRGPGAARNLAIKQAYIDKCPFICFLDSDDIAHKNRVEITRKNLVENEDVDIVYSTFELIDENGKRIIDLKNVIEGIKIIKQDLKERPLEGYDVWKEIVINRDNLTIPSALNVRTDLAINVLFPEDTMFHEDIHTWLRYSGIGGYVKYDDSIFSLYRIPQNVKASESRMRAGGIEEFNRMRCKVVMEGLNETLSFAAKRKVIKSEEMDVCRVRYLLSVAYMIEKEGTLSVYDELIQQANGISPKLYNFYKK